MGIFDMFHAKVSVELADKKHSVAAGGVLRGVVRLTITSQTAFRAVRLELWGTEEVVSHQATSFGSFSSPAALTGSHASTRTLVFHEVITLAGHTKRSQETAKLEAEPGAYVYPFEVKLPETLPPTHRGFAQRMMGNSISTTYHARAVMEVPLSVKNPSADIPFVVTVPTPRGQLDSIPIPVDKHNFVLQATKDGAESGMLMTKVALSRGFMAAGMPCPSSPTAMAAPSDYTHGREDAVHVRIMVDNTGGTEPVTAILAALVMEAHIKIGDKESTDNFEKLHVELPEEVQVGERKEVTIPLVVHADHPICSSYAGICATISYNVVVGFRVPHHHCQTVSLPLVVVQGIDEENRYAPATWVPPTKSGEVQPGLEYAWVAPVRPLVNPVPMPCGVREHDVPDVPYRPHEGHGE